MRFSSPKQKRIAFKKWFPMDESRSATTEVEVLTETMDFETMDSEDAAEELSVKSARLVRFLWGRKKTVLTVTAVGVGCALLYALLLPNVYSSITSLMPPDNTSPYSNILSSLAGPGGGITSAALGMETPAELYAKILESRNVQDGLIARYDLIRQYEVRLQGDARRRLASDTNIDEDVKSGVITITTSANSPALAANLANGYVEELNRVLTTDTTSSARRERVFLEERIKQVKADLDGASRALSQFSSKSKTIDLDSQAKSMVDSGLRLETDLIAARSDAAGLRQAYSEDNVRVKAAEARIAELQRQLNQMGGTSSGSGGKGTGGQSLYPNATELPGLGLTYADLDRKVKVDEELWEALTKQYEAAKVDEVKALPTARVLDVGIVPEKKSAPTRWLIMVIGTILSFLIGCLVVIGLEHWNAMDPQDEWKKLAQEIAFTMQNILKRRGNA
jgi:uncharacterized protein involved in exopolysaccharide biosynthesis